METKYLYLILILLALAYPMAQSFEHRLRFYRQWKFLFPGLLIMMLVFIPWDVYFTKNEIWWFNDRYLTGLRIVSLPIEEWLFFVVVPFACIFLYEVLNYFVKQDYFRTIANYVYALFAIVLISLSVMHFGKLYTTITFLSTAVALIILVLWNPHWKGRFFQMYLVSWIPFLLMNGALTGNFTQEAVVNYNPDHIIGLRITTIPVEDSVYSFLMLLIVVSCYEYFKRIFRGN